MATSTSGVNVDTPITLKVILDGHPRRFKLPLRSLGVHSLEKELRAVLSIAHEANCRFERYSDSAGAYIVLDRNDASVYKQLYRAAKAKQKLKLRISTSMPEPAPKPATVPRPVSVEDAPDSSDSPFPSVQPEVAVEPPVSSSSIPLRPGRPAAELQTRSDPVPVSVPIPAPAAEIASPSAPPSAPYVICCNSCDETIPNVHYHCNHCDGGDFDLCQSCVDKGITCNGREHWMIKRFLENGVFVNSTTESTAPKPKPKPVVPEPALQPWSIAEQLHEEDRLASQAADRLDSLFKNLRTCNSCIHELPESHFVHCTVCEDFDLCKTCFRDDRHGHHPKHAFVPAVEGGFLLPSVQNSLAAGRGQTHDAVCDGCNKTIFGVRHKCLDCPDWDYCSACVSRAPTEHQGHRFAPLYEPIEPPAHLRTRLSTLPTHFGICCDGPLCSTASGDSNNRYISGDRYKCAVCHDTDFCANCEASPANRHNKTHPLIKFKTPVKFASVSTTGELHDGRSMPAMGDQCPRSPPRPSTSSRATETTVTNHEIVRTNVLTVADLQPSEPAKKATEEPPAKQEAPPAEKPVKKPVEKPAETLVAAFQRDTVSDGTVLPPNHVFEQTWVLRNEGTVAWPAACSVKFVGGDYMGYIDANHPAGVKELLSASESTSCREPIAPGQEFPFTMRLRTPAREGRVISYWRLTTPEGIKFGHRLWCDVDVQAPKVEQEKTAEPKMAEQEDKKKTPEPKSESTPKEGQMIFPKLDKESPAASIHQQNPASGASAVASDKEDFEDYSSVEEWGESGEDGFFTDEEYDILDASDEEFLEEQGKQLRK